MKVQKAIEKSPQEQLIESMEAMERANCPACIARRCHTAEENREHHPRTGHGFTPETGWTHPDLVRHPAR